MFKMKVLCMFWICKFFIIFVIDIIGVISFCGSFLVFMVGGLIFCFFMVVSILFVIIIVSFFYNIM